jgi:hypothetical protein
MKTLVVETLLFLVGLPVSFGLPWLARRWLRSGRPSTTVQAIVDNGASGKVIPLIATFSGLRDLPLVGSRVTISSVACHHAGWHYVPGSRPANP